jgi:hypothetical protein
VPRGERVPAQITPDIRRVKENAAISLYPHQHQNH